jgi:subtilisin-like proprotein convertase family protein
MKGALWRGRRLIATVAVPILALVGAATGHAQPAGTDSMPAAGVTTTRNAPAAAWCNDAHITVPDSGVADPYPSSIAVDGVGSSAADVTVRLNDFSHTFPSDVSVMLVSPTGQNLVLMSGTGGNDAVVEVDLTFSDRAVDALPSEALTTGTFRPTVLNRFEDWPDPAPAPSDATSLATFNGSSANGAWNLYLIDLAGGDAGSISGWCLELSVDVQGPVARPTVSPAAGASGWHRGDVTVTWNWSDAGSGIDHGRCTDLILTNRQGRSTLTATCRDRSGNPSSATRTLRIDGTLPTVRIVAPTARRYLQGSVARADYACGDAHSGLANCVGTVADGARINTSTVGHHQLTVTAVDRAGNRRTTTLPYTVITRPLCSGKQVTMLGTARADVLTGTTGNDVILAGNGRDTINGRGGADTVCAGAGDDLLRGLSGNDHLDGGRGIDICRGGAGGDRAVACELVFSTP